MMRPESSKRMRTKNPFCTGTQLVVLRTIKAHSGLRVVDMARKARMSVATFSHALVQLLKLGHIEKAGYGRYRVARSGSYLIDCAARLTKLQPTTS